MSRASLTQTVPPYILNNWALCKQAEESMHRHERMDRAQSITAGILGALWGGIWIWSSTQDHWSPVILLCVLTLAAFLGFWVRNSHIRKTLMPTEEAWIYLADRRASQLWVIMTSYEDIHQMLRDHPDNRLAQHMVLRSNLMLDALRLLKFDTDPLGTQISEDNIDDDLPSEAERHEMALDRILHNLERR